jgi:hypothetical protein
MYEEFAVVAEEDVQPLQPEHPITHALVVAKSRLPTPPVFAGTARRGVLCQQCSFSICSMEPDKAGGCGVNRRSAGRARSPAACATG